MQEIMTRIELGGALGKTFGRAHDRLIRTTAEAINALSKTICGFEQYLNTSKNRGLTYAVFKGKRNIGKDDLCFPVTGEVIRIIPVVIGSKKAGLLQTVLGAVLVVVGVAVGFGAQTIVKDIITGFFIIFEGQFDVSDYVQINASGVTIAEGTVKTIGLRSTRIQSDTGEIYTLPNGMISEIVNYSATDVSPIVMIPISPNENYKVIEEKLLTFLPTLKNKYDIFVSAPDLLGLDSVDGNEMVIKLLAHVKPGMHFPGQRLLRKEVIQYFSEEGIHIPKPTLVKLDKELNKKE